jgi:NAD(P)-dependent dehydrogenase (short-subunit alcohol dehydrogenase family)
MKRTALITGASSGIGELATNLLAHRNWVVRAGYRTPRGRERLLNIHRENVCPLKLDVTDAASVNRARKLLRVDPARLSSHLGGANEATRPRSPQQLIGRQCIISRHIDDPQNAGDGVNADR